MSVPKKHKEEAKIKNEDVKFGIVVVSTSRYEALTRGEVIPDKSGDIAIQIISNANYVVCFRTIIPDSKPYILRVIARTIEEGCNVLLFIGGTGISKSDITIETLKPIIEKEITGFGEIFRHLSYQEIGSPAMLSRALAGTYQGIVIFAVPGSPNAVKLALEKLILPEIKHILYLVTKE